MKIKNKLVILCSVATISSGCAVNQNGQVVANPKVFNKESFLSLGGGVLGAVLCNQLFKNHGSKEGWTAACGVAGYYVSKSFLARSNKALENNKIGQTSTWKDPDGKNYAITPTRTYSENNKPCREYRQTIEINGQTEILTGQACRQANGTWTTK